MIARFLVLALVVVGCTAVQSAQESTTTPSYEVTRPNPNFPWSQEEALRRATECLDEAGIDWTLEPDGSLSAHYPPEQAEEMGAAGLKCFHEQWGLEEGESFPAPTREDWEWLYPQLLAAQKCLAGQGIETPPAPSLDTFLEDPSWSPYERLPFQLGLEKLAEVEKVCPQPYL